MHVFLELGFANCTQQSRMIVFCLLRNPFHAFLHSKANPAPVGVMKCAKCQQMDVTGIPRVYTRELGLVK